MRVGSFQETAFCGNALISPGPVYSLLSSTSDHQRSQRRPDILYHHLDHCVEFKITDLNSILERIENSRKYPEFQKIPRILEKT